MRMQVRPRESPPLIFPVQDLNVTSWKKLQRGYSRSSWVAAPKQHPPPNTVMLSAYPVHHLKPVFPFYHSQEKFLESQWSSNIWFISNNPPYCLPYLRYYESISLLGGIIWRTDLEAISCGWCGKTKHTFRYKFIYNSDLIYRLINLLVVESAI